MQLSELRTDTIGATNYTLIILAIVFRLVTVYSSNNSGNPEQENAASLNVQILGYSYIIVVNNSIFTKAIN